MRNSALLEALLRKVESLTILDRPADGAQALLNKALPAGPVEDALSGTPVGHPAHPIFVTFPIGAWAAASVIDLTGGDAKAARRAIAFGNLIALPTALTGANDWRHTSGPQRRVGLAHAALNYAALGLQTASWLARGRGQRVRGATLSLVGHAVVGASGWLGSQLTYAYGVGVNTTAFEQLPAHWTDIAAVGDVPAEGMLAVELGRTTVRLAHVDGVLLALDDRCTHRGAPLHEGRLVDGCVECPWHGSRFALADGAVRSGPASRPQPAYEIRTVDDRVQVRRPAAP